MAVPLLLMAAKIVGASAARAALKKGGQAALRSIVKNAQGVKRIAEGSNKGRKSISKAAPYNRPAMISKTKALAAGAAGGAGGATALKKEKKKSTPTPKPRPDQRTNPSDFPTYKKGSKSAKAFQEAFAKAKKEGNKTFKFEGRTYKVETKK